MDGSYLCPECNFPLCGEMCAYGGEHADRECKVFSRVEPKIEIKDFTKEGRVTFGSELNLKGELQRTYYLTKYF